MSNIIQLAEAKGYLRVDITDDDTLIQTFCDAAEGYLTNATGLVFSSSNAQAKTVCLMLVAAYYTNRENGLQLSATTQSVVNSLITQLAIATVITPPQVPVGLTGVAMADYAWLRWQPNVAPDVAGYNVYRDGVKINTDLVRENAGQHEEPFFLDDWPYTDEQFQDGTKAPPGVVQYRDQKVTSGQTNSYQITAVDDLGNESPKSAAVQVTQL